ncbi:MAG: CCA tRNA nucleotidyltransferase [Candidatus Aenigmarchaeota archaeon]|nr:CCA tRNA nucleotidyltransferase [Candidatus Aenigmarchaeota archaeon]
MTNYDKISKEALKQVRPTKEQRRKLESLANKTLSLTKKVAKRYKAKAMLAGSITRDTWLPNKNEFDVFALFPEKLTKKQLETTGLQVGKVVITKLKGEYEIAYAEHPYVSGKINDISIDIVPCYEVTSTEHLKSAVDRTPFHVRYIEKKLPLGLSDEVRLLKKFLVSNGMYGADTKVLGYSGYVCELLIIAYRSFLNVLKASVKWTAGEIIDMEKFYAKQDYQKLVEMFKGQALILLDPTDKTRNTAAALSAFNFFKFKKYAQMFLDSPSLELMIGKDTQPLGESELIELQMKRRTELVVVKFIPPKVVPDILWPQLRRFADRLQSILEETKYEFKVLNKDVFTDERFIATAILEMEVSKLPAMQKKVGPSIFDLKDAENFLNKYKEQAIGIYPEDGFWVAEVNRDFLTARDKLVDSLTKPLDILKAKGIPNHIAERIANGFEVFSETERIMQVVQRNTDFGVFLRKYFEREKLS